MAQLHDFMVMPSVIYFAFVLMQKNKINNIKNMELTREFPHGIFSL